jgi:glutamate formiminotransferase
MVELFESVPNFSEGRHGDTMRAITEAASKAFVLDSDADPDHNRLVVTIAGRRERLIDALVEAIAKAVEKIDLRRHAGVHPRVGAADVVPIVPIGDATLEASTAAARELAERVWTDLRVPVYFYGHGEHKTLADIRAGRAKLDLGGPDLHPTAGAVCIGARSALVAFNVMLYDIDVVGARAVAGAIRETGGGLRGVQALAFRLPGDRVQLSMNLFRTNETTPSAVITELRRRGVEVGAEQVVGLCPAAVANATASGRLLEGRLAGSAALQAASLCMAHADEEHQRLATRLSREGADLQSLPSDQDSILAGAERAAALRPVLNAAGVFDGEVDAMLLVAANGLRAGLSTATEAKYRPRVDALDARLA